MKQVRWAMLGLPLLLMSAAPVAAQLGLPSLPSLDIPTTVDRVGNTGLVSADLDNLPTRDVARLLDRRRIDRLRDFVRDNRDVVEFDRDRNPAVRATLLVLGMNEDKLRKARAAGFKVAERGRIEALDIDFVRLTTPGGMSLAKAEKQLARIAPDAEIDADNIYFQSGDASAIAASAMLATGAASGARLGLIDGGVATHPVIANVRQRGFAKGAPRASAHGTAVAALMIGQGKVKGSASGAPLLAADIYGTDKAGGNALAIAHALGWLSEEGIAVTTISLVGPSNRLLKRAVASAQAKGMIIVAAVGNDGPAAPPAFPAAYSGVVGVTGVDRRNRLLPEASRKSDTDFSAPGKDFDSADAKGGMVAVRGTSYAAPLVAGRILAHYSRPSPSLVPAALRRLVGEAEDIGDKGHDSLFGNGLICGECVLR